MLYDQSNVEDQYVTYPSEEQNGNGIFTSHKVNKNIEGRTWTLKMLIPGNMGDHFSVEAGDMLSAQ